MAELFGKLMSRLTTLAIAGLIIWSVAEPVAEWMGRPAPTVKACWCLVLMLETAGFVLRGKTLMSEQDAK